MYRFREISESLALSDNNKHFEYDVIIGGTADEDELLEM